MSAVVLKVAFGAVFLTIVVVGTSVMLTYVGVRALRTGQHTERGVRYTGKSARQIGWFYIAGAVASIVMLLIVLIFAEWKPGPLDAYW